MRKNLKCDLCGETFPCYSLLKQHKYERLGCNEVRTYSSRTGSPGPNVQWSNIERFHCSPYRRHTLYTKIQPPAKPANGQFGCDRCSSTFDTMAELEAHCHSHTLNLKSFKCKFCERRFNLLHRLKEHEEWTWPAYQYSNLEFARPWNPGINGRFKPRKETSRGTRQ